MAGHTAETPAMPRITARVTAGIISTPSPVPAGQNHSADPGSRKVGSPTLSPVPGTSKPVTSTKAFSNQSTGPAPSLPDPALNEEKSALTMAAFGVISFIVILVVVVIFLVCVVSLRFKCNRSKDAEDKQKPESMVSESCSAATAKKNSITLISMKNLSTNNSMSYPASEKVL
ncbi:endothelial cell-specific chemotaxis regulator isoform X2 [Emydura macquarii macquarii]